MLDVRGLTTTYGAVVALDDVTFSAPRARITAVLGANGAGKTTLLRTLSGLVPPVRGSVTLAGTDLLTLAPEEMTRVGMAHVPEGRGVITELTVEENLRLGRLGARAGAESASGPAAGVGGGAHDGLERVYDLFPVLGDRRKQIAHQLSGGERQMLVVARALLAEPSILLLDEPSLGLAPRVVSQIFDLLRRLVDDEGLTVLLVEQNARSALSIADIGLVLDLGRVVAIEDAAVLAGDDALRHAYLGF